jgi:hypothetical protein
VCVLLLMELCNFLYLGHLFITVSIAMTFSYIVLYQLLDLLLCLIDCFLFIVFILFLTIVFRIINC